MIKQTVKQFYHQDNEVNGLKTVRHHSVCAYRYFLYFLNYLLLYLTEDKVNFIANIVCQQAENEMSH